ncbi:MAG: hypothetical protein ACK4G2_02385 [Novosphingobium sp.]
MRSLSELADSYTMPAKTRRALISLNSSLEATREFLIEVDDDGTFEGVVALDLFRAAIVAPDLTAHERARQMLVSMAWLSGYMAGNERLPDALTTRAAVIDSAIGDFREF